MESIEDKTYKSSKEKSLGVFFPIELEPNACFGVVLRPKEGSRVYYIQRLGNGIREFLEKDKPLERMDFGDL